MECKSYIIRCLTNMHMGSGDANFSVVDNEVQKDSVNGCPVMYASGIKGALRDHFNTVGFDDIETVFGSDIKKSRKDKRDASQQGNVRFLTANLLFIPIRAGKGPVSYFMATSKGLLQEWNMIYSNIYEKDLAPGLGDKIKALDEKAVYSDIADHDLKIEDNNYSKAVIKKLDEGLLSFIQEMFPETVSRLLIVPEGDLSQISLPVMARNQLENGISNNLWYEEIVPHESVFSFHVVSNGTAAGDNALESFDNVIGQYPLVQFGGNATIGYGLTKVSAY